MKKPTVFGKYLLLERINVGGMAEVFTAKAFGVEGFERILAIKKILPTMAEDQEFITMFIDEARISVQLNHANIVHIHELGKEAEAFYIAMEYVAGRDLRTILERYRRRKEIMPTAQAVFVASKMCEGLDYAHRKKDARGVDLNIIHRDVSPQNILCSYEGEVKIIDFGIAKAANRSQKTQAGILKGKFGYMSPEQVRGLPIDRRSDIFAVGVILYETLTGEKLFVGESDFSTLEKVRNAEIPEPRQFNPNISPGLEKVVLKALAREQEDRYQWASDLQEDLMRFLLAGEAIYSSKHLSAFMKEAFAEEMEREAQQMERYAAMGKSDFELSEITASEKKGKKAPISGPVTLPGIRGSGPKRRPSRGAMPATHAEGGDAEREDPIEDPGATSAERVRDPVGPLDRTQIVGPSSASPREESDGDAGAIDNAPTGSSIPAFGDQTGDITGHERTLPPSRASPAKAQVVIGDKVPYAGETVVRAVPAPEPADRLNEAGLSDSTVLRPRLSKEIPRELTPVPGPVGADSTASGHSPVPGAAEPESEESELPSGAVSQIDEASPNENTQSRSMSVPVVSSVSAPPQARPSGRGLRWTLAVVLTLVAAIGLGLVALKVTSKPKGRLRITTEPAGAQVMLGGHPVAAGEELALTPGVYELVASAEGFQESRTRVLVVEGPTPIVKLVTLAPVEAGSPGKPPSVDAGGGRPSPPAIVATPVTRPLTKTPAVFTAKFNSREAGVEVLIDGKSVGRTPNAKVSGLTQGKSYRVTARRAGYKPLTKELSSEGRGEVELNVTLEKEDPPPRPVVKAKGKLACASKPAGARVIVDGKDTGRVTPVGITSPLVLPVGKHQVSFRLENKQSGPHSVEISESEIAILNNITLD
jgi:serine/threonine protein kinase